MTDSSKGKLYILLAAVFWSLGGVLIKVIPWSPFGITGTRSILSFIVLLLYRGFDKKFQFNKVIVYAGICASFTNILFVYANKMTSAANAIVLQCTAPIFVVLMSIFLLKKKPTINQLITVFITIFGIIIFFMDQLSAGALIGNILALLSGVSYAGMFYFNNLEESNPLESSILAHGMNFLVSLPVLLRFNEPMISMAGVYGIIILGVVQMGFSYICFSEGILLCESISASLISMVEAILNPILVALVLNEIPSAYSLIGSVIVLCAVTFNIVKKD